MTITEGLGEFHLLPSPSYHLTWREVSLIPLLEWDKWQCKRKELCSLRTLWTSRKNCLLPQIFHKQAPSTNILWWGSGQATPKYSILVHWLFWLKVTYTAGAKRTLLPSLVPPESRNKSPMWKVPSLYQEVERYPSHQGGNSGVRRGETNLVTSLLIDNHSPNLSHQVFTNLLFKMYKSCLLHSVLWASFSMSFCMYKLVFVPLICLRSI